MRPFTKTGVGRRRPTTMATSTFPIVVFSALVASLLDEFDNQA